MEKLRRVMIGQDSKFKIGNDINDTHIGSSMLYNNQVRRYSQLKNLVIEI